MTILYFTATGNSLYVAKRLGGKLISIPQMIKENKYEFSDERIGIVFPVFHVNIPPYIRDFLERSIFNCKYLFVIATYGEYAGSTADEVKKILDKRSIPANYINNIQMLDNFIPAFDMNEQRERDAIKNIEGQIDVVRTAIDNRMNFIIEDSEEAKAITGSSEFGTEKLLIDLGIKEGESLDSAFSVDASCNQCGTCVKVCPLGNITLEKQPVYHNNCMACVNVSKKCLMCSPSPFFYT